MPVNENGVCCKGSYGEASTPVAKSKLQPIVYEKTGILSEFHEDGLINESEPSQIFRVPKRRRQV